MDQICSDPVTAGDQLLAAVQAGGQEAQVWVDALLTADCLENPSSPNDAYQQAINTLNPEGDPTDLPAVARLVLGTGHMVQCVLFCSPARDQSGPLCASPALAVAAGFPTWRRRPTPSARQSAFRWLW